MKFLVVDDHPLVRSAIREVIRDARGADSIVLEAASGIEALGMADEHADIALVLLDLSLPGADGFETLRELRRRRPGIPVAILSASEEREVIARALDAGAVGYITKSSPSGMLGPVLELVLSGGTYVPRAAVGHGGEVATPAATAPAAPARSQLGLTERQRDVLALLVEGKPTKAICRDLGLSEGTVKNHINVIFRALNVRNRTEAVVAAAKLGLQPHPVAARGHSPDLSPK